MIDGFIMHLVKTISRVVQYCTEGEGGFNERLRELRAKTRALQRLPFAFCVHRAASVFIKRLLRRGPYRPLMRKSVYPPPMEEGVLRGV